MKRWEANQLVEDMKTLWWLARHTAPFDDILIAETIYFEVSSFRDCLDRFRFQIKFYIENRIPYELKRAYRFKDINIIRDYEQYLRAGRPDDIPF